jgi:hypothetical protein
MRVLALSIVVTCTVALAACSPDKAPDAPPAPPQKTVFDPLTQQMDRARQVQGTVDTQTQDTRKAIEAAEGGEAPR